MRRSRRSVLSLALGAALCAAVIACAPASLAKPRSPDRSAASADRAKHGGIRSVLALPGEVSALAAGSGALYASYARPSRRDQQVVVRFKPKSGSYRKSKPLPGGQGGSERLAVAGHHVWVAGGTASGRGGGELLGLSPRTLRERRNIGFPEHPTSLAVARGHLWVAAGHHLYSLDPSSGDLGRSVRFRGRVRHLVASPSGGRLYVATSGPVRHDSPPLMELRAATGAVLASTHVGFAELNGPSGLAATDAGVWVSSPTGMMGTLTLLSASDLQPAARVRRGGSNAINGSVARGFLWVRDDKGVRCADPADGHRRGKLARWTTSLDGNATAFTSGVYIGGEGILRISVHRACH